MSAGALVSLFSNRNILSPTKKPDPFLNISISTLRSSVSQTLAQVRKKKRYINAYEQKNAILTGLVNMVATDINEKVYFEPENKKDSNRNRVKSAWKFYERNRFRGMLFSILIDTLVTGEGYAWLGRLNKDSLMKEVSKQLENKGFPVNPFTQNMFLKSNFPDEADPTLRDIRYIASSTMENLFDEHNIIEYVQNVGVNKRLYKPKDVIHTVVYDVNGRPGGFTPVDAMIDQLLLDFFMWKNMRALAQNSGQPDRMYSVEDADFNTPAFKRIEQELRKYHEVYNRHGSLLLNGKITVHDLQQLDNMQFQELGFYIATLFALQWRIPKSRLPFILKNTSTKDDTGGNADKGYYDNISYWQDCISTIMNQQLWQPFFKVKMKFRKGYKQDEVRETNTQVQRMEILEKMQTQYRALGKQLKDEYITRYINRVSEEVEPQDLKEIPKEELENQMQPGAGVGSMSPKDAVDDGPKKALSEQRSQEQNASAANRGTPTGTGKEDLVKDLEGKESLRVPFLTFLNLYNEDKTFNKEPPRVFMSESNGMTRFVYKSTDFMYESIVPTEEINRTQMLNFRKVIVLRDSDLLEVIDNREEE